MIAERDFFFAVLLLALLSLFSTVSMAVNGWDTNAGLTAQTIVTDNLNLSADDPNSDVGIRIRPSVGVRRDTRRNKLYFQYAVDYLDYIDSTAQDNFRHFLTANWNSELYKDIRFLDARANADQNLILGFGRAGGDDFNDTRNTTQTFTYAISPYTKHHFGNYADLELRYTYDQVLYSESSARDSHSNSVDFSLDSGRKFQQIPWSITGRYRRVTYDE